MRMATLMLLSLASSMSAASWPAGMGAVMVFSLGSGGRPTVRCFWCASKSVQAYRAGERDHNQSERRSGEEGMSRKWISRLLTR